MVVVFFVRDWQSRVDLLLVTAPLLDEKIDVAKRGHTRRKLKKNVVQRNFYI